jgi:nitrile hydratase accessory protein
VTSSVPDIPGLPRNGEGPVFGAPWQAQAFAMTVALHQQGLFTWPEWAQALSVRIAQAPAEPDEDAGTAYFLQWLAALEDMVARKGASSAAELTRYRQAWDHAADRTPHGQPITLVAADFPAQAQTS